MIAPGRGKTRVGLLFGGRSGEHEISIRSARFVSGAIDRRRFEVALIGICRSGLWHLHTEETFRGTGTDAAGSGTRRVMPAQGDGTCRLIDPEASTAAGPDLEVLFPVLHGPNGEDGTIQGLFETLDVPYVGAGVLGSAVGMDKDVQKRLLEAAGLPVVPFCSFRQNAWRREANVVRARAAELGAPVFVKPANLGSSLGITRVSSPAELDRAVDLALELDTKVIIERAVDAREIECAILGNDEPRASVPGEIVPGAEFYSYEAKYDARSEARLLIPAPLPPHLSSMVQKLAVESFQVLEGAGMARVDFFLERGTDQLYVNELNTIPGFTSVSMYPKLWEASGVSSAELTTRLIELALDRHAEKHRRPCP